MIRLARLLRRLADRLDPIDAPPAQNFFYWNLPEPYSVVTSSNSSFGGNAQQCPVCHIWVLGNSHVCGGQITYETSA